MQVNHYCMVQHLLPTHHLHKFLEVNLSVTILVDILKHYVCSLEKHTGGPMILQAALQGIYTSIRK